MIPTSDSPVYEEIEKFCEVMKKFKTSRTRYERLIHEEYRRLTLTRRKIRDGLSDYYTE